MNRPMFCALLIGSSILLGAPLTGCGGGGSSSADPVTPSSLAEPAPSQATGSASAPVSQPAAAAAAQPAASAATDSSEAAAVAYTPDPIPTATPAINSTANGNAAAPSLDTRTAAAEQPQAASTTSTDAPLTATSQNVAAEAAPSDAEAPPDVQALAALANTDAAQIKAIAAPDVVAALNPSSTFKSLGWKWAVECGGKTVGGLNIAETGIAHTNLADQYGSLRFGKVSDPDSPNRKVLLFRAHRDDPLVYSAPRCEASTSPTSGGAIPVGKTIWFAFGIRLDRWTNTTDEQIVAQFHQGNGTIPLNPFFAISVKGNGLRVVLRHNNNLPVSRATTATVVAAETATLPKDKWSYIVVRAVISPSGDLGSHVKVWQDQKQIVDYLGPFGYNYPSLQPFVKMGHYHWIDSTNPWPAATPIRTVLMRTPVLVRDDSNKYAELDLRAYVIAR